MQLLVYDKTCGEKHFSIYLCFLGKRFGICPRRGRHPVEPHAPPRKVELLPLPYRRGNASDNSGQGFSRLLSGNGYTATLRQAADQRSEIECTHHLEIFVRSVIAGTYNFGSGVRESNALTTTELRDALPVEMFSIRGNESVAVAEKDKSHNPPHIVLKIRIVKIHRPTRSLRRKAAEHQ